VCDDRVRVIWRPDGLGFAVLAPVLHFRLRASLSLVSLRNPIKIVRVPPVSVP
jgi:hypothetical protein